MPKPWQKLQFPLVGRFKFLPVPLELRSPRLLRKGCPKPSHNMISYRLLAGQHPRQTPPANAQPNSYSLRAVLAENAA
jgi:hypothetical protein